MIFLIKSFVITKSFLVLAIVVLNVNEEILKSNDSPFVAFSMTLLFGVIYLGSIKDS